MATSKPPFFPFGNDAKTAIAPAFGGAFDTQQTAKAPYLQAEVDVLKKLLDEKDAQLKHVCDMNSALRRDTEHLFNQLSHTRGMLDAAWEHIGCLRSQINPLPQDQEQAFQHEHIENT
jgi:hypothetical protein